MELQLKSQDLDRAIEMYVRSMVTVADGMEVTTTFKAGRNGNGFTAAVDISPVSEAPAEAPVASPEPVSEPETETVTETVDATEESTETVEEADDTVEETAEPSDEPAAVTTQSDSIFGNG